MSATLTPTKSAETDETWNPDATVQAVDPGFDPFDDDPSEAAVVHHEAAYDAAPAVPAAKPKRQIRHCEFRDDGTVFIPVAGGLTFKVSDVPAGAAQNSAAKWIAQQVMRDRDPAAKLHAILLGITDRREKGAGVSGDGTVARVAKQPPGRKPSSISLQAMAHTLVEVTAAHGTPITLDAAHEKVAAFTVEQRQRLTKHPVYSYHKHLLGGGNAPGGLDDLV